MSTRVSPRRREVLVKLAAAIAAVPGVANAADNTWNGSTDANWATDDNWSLSVKPTSSDLAIFPTPAPLTGNTINLVAPEQANALRFVQGYTLSGGELTLTTGGVQVGYGGGVATIASLLHGSSGLTKTGLGILHPTNTSNDFSGTITVSNGTLAISDPASLGAPGNTISITGTSTSTGGGGSLLLRNTSLGRDVSVQGTGPFSGSGALVNVGHNTLSGTVSGNTTLNGRIVNASGSLTFSGTLTAPGTAATNLTILGSGSQAGPNSYYLTGALSGSGTLQKTGSGTLFFNPSSVSGFSGTIRVSTSSAVGGLSSIRFASASPISLGTSTANTTTGSVLDLDGGLVEIRMDTPVLLSGGANVNSYLRSSTTTTLIADHGVGGVGMNGVVALGEHRFEDGLTVTFTSRNGYGFAIPLAQVITGDGSSTITSNTQGGQVEFTGNFWNNTNATGNRTMTVNGSGNVLISGNLLGNGGASWNHNLTKSGTGTLTITGTESTLDGAVNVQQGTLAIADFRSVTDDLTTNNSNLTLGNSTFTGTLNIIGVDVPAANLTTARPLSLPGSTGGGAILANQSGASPGVVFTSTANLTSGAGTKTLTLGGSNTGENRINGAIVNNTTDNITLLVKTDPGTWGLAGTNTSTGALLISNGTLKLHSTGATSTVWDNATAIGFGLNATAQSAGGRLELRGAGLVSDEIVGPLNVVSGANTVSVIPGDSDGAAASLKFVSLGTTATTSAATTTTVVTVISTSGLVPGMIITGTGATANATINAITSGTTFTASASQNFANGAVLTFSRPSGVVGNGGGTVNFAAPAGGNVIIGTVPAVGLLNAYSYFNGADFAYAPATTDATLRAPAYDGSDAGFNTVAAAGSLTAGSNNFIDGASGTAGVVTQGSIVTIPTLKLAGATTLTANAAVTLQTAANSPGGILVSGGAAIINGTGGSVTTGGTGDLVIRTDLATDELTLSVPISNPTTGGAGLTKSGAGTLILTATNAQTGVTNINEGAVKLSGTGRLSAANVTLNLRQGATLDLNGVGTGTAIGQFNGAGVITNTNATAATLTVGNNNGTGTFSGIIQDGTGVVRVTKAGTGGQTWSGASTYTGVTTIGSGGIVSVPNLANIGVASGIGRGDSTNNAASLVFTGTSNSQASGGISYTGTAAVLTDRLFTLAGTSTTSSSARIQANGVNNVPIVFGNPAAIPFGTANLHQLVFGGASTGDNRFNPQLNDNGPARLRVFKADAGVWHLGNPENNYTGTTTIALGQLGADSGTTLPTNSPLVFSGTTSGVLLTTGSFERNLVATPTDGNPNEVTWTAGGGFAARAGKLVVAIGGVASPAPLTWGAGGFATGTLYLNSTIALDETEFRNPIDLNGATRTVQVDDNANTGADFATISGVISGETAGSNLTKSGGGILSLTGANTYSGTTGVNAGALIVSSLGHTDSPGPSSVGTSLNANTDTSAITLGSGTTTGGLLIYVGAGEISNRKIRLNTTTATNQIHANGSGPLVLAGLANDMVDGAKTLQLRGTSPYVNRITSQLSNRNGNLAVTIDSSIWSLANSSNNFTGNVTVNGGALGIGADNALGDGTLTVNNGSVFADGGDRVISNTVSHTNNATATFFGDHSISAGNYALQATTASPTLTNNISPTELLTFSGATFNAALTANRTLTVTGIGNTNIGSITTSQILFNLSLTHSGSGTLTLTGTSSLIGSTTAGGAVISQTGANGKLIVASGSITANSANVNVATGTIGGGGAIVAPLTITSGTLAPGNSVGTLTVGNSATTNGLSIAGTAANMLAELDAATGDKVIVVGNTTSTGSGAAHLKISLVNGAIPENVTYVLIDNSGGNVTPKLFADVQLVSGGNGPQSIATFALDGTTASTTDWIATDTSGNFFRIDYNVDAGLGHGSSPNDVVLTVVAVPEPAAIGVLALAGIGLLSGRRRRPGGDR